jgi:hypothetical protein
MFKQKGVDPKDRKVPKERDFITSGSTGSRTWLPVSLGVEQELKAYSRRRERLAMKSTRFAIFLLVSTLVMCILLGCLHNTPPIGNKSESFQKKVDDFIQEGPEFLGRIIVSPKNDVIGKLGEPLNMTRKEVKNRHDDVMDTVYELVYEGLYLEIYEVTLDNRSFVYHIVVTGKKYKPKWGLGVGTTKSQVKAALGNPDETNMDEWSYVASDVFPHSVIFYFEKDRVQKIEWLYILD